jgi:hypothetical protein
MMVREIAILIDLWNNVNAACILASMTAEITIFYSLPWQLKSCRWKGLYRSGGYLVNISTCFNFC